MYLIIRESLILQRKISAMSNISEAQRVLIVDRYIRLIANRRIL